jgi:hypothetical protein
VAPGPYGALELAHAWGVEAGRGMGQAELSSPADSEQYHHNSGIGLGDDHSQLVP